MNPRNLFVDEIADFLLLWNKEKCVMSLNFPFPCFYFDVQKLAIHCIPLDFANDDISVSVKLTDKCASEGIKVIHIWEDVWRTKTEVVKSRLRAVFGSTERIPARLTKTKRIDKPTLETFLKENHLQIPTNAKFKYGLFLPKIYTRIIKSHLPLLELFMHSQEVLVAVASFSGGKNIVRDGQTYRSFELIRFANLLDCTVVGGLDKLLKAFVRELNPDDIMTYADRDWSNGHSYQRLGFERIEATPPQVFLVNPGTYERHYEARIVAQETSDEWVKVYNSGNWKFLKRLKTN